jgi:hypothetical protein
MGFSRDDHPWVGPVPGSPNVYMAAGYTGHGMPNTWLCGSAIADCVGGALARGLEDSEAIRLAGDLHGLPPSYRITEERLKHARGIETVQNRDAREMALGVQLRQSTV